MVVVTTSHSSKGLFETCAATRPEMWAMSILRATGRQRMLRECSLCKEFWRT